MCLWTQLIKIKSMLRNRKTHMADTKSESSKMKKAFGKRNHTSLYRSDLNQIKYNSVCKERNVIAEFKEWSELRYENLNKRKNCNVYLYDFK